MKQIKLTQGKIALVDDRDFDYLNQWKWYAYKGSRNGRLWYAETSRFGEKTKMHRKLMGLEKGDGKYVDHINHDGLDNRRKNVRVVGQSYNTQNARRFMGVSKYRGVSKNRTGKPWLSYIKVNGKSKYLGSYDVEQEAAKAYNNAAKKYYGSFALINNL